MKLDGGLDITTNIYNCHLSAARILHRIPPLPVVKIWRHDIRACLVTQNSPWRSLHLPSLSR